MPPNNLVLAACLLVACLALRCNTTTEPTNSHALNNPEMVLAGQQLAARYCVACHQLPKPQLLNKATWQQYVLPRMGYMLGLYPHDSVRASLIEAGEGGRRVLAANVFPEQPAISWEAYQQIEAYYLHNAPDSLLMPIAQPLSTPLKQFKVIKPNYQLAPPSTTMLQMATDGGFYLGDAHTQTLYRFNAALSLTAAAKVREGAVAMQETGNALLVTVMGSFSPTDAPSGLVVALPKDKSLQPSVVLKQLQRPVHSEMADLNGDQLPDIVTCEFGKWTGSLCWWRNEGNQTYQRQILYNKPGAIKAYVRDLNKDGLPDVIALFGQADEGIFAFYNQGNGQFAQKRLLRFPASYGSSYFNLHDFNGDDHQDIIYTAGDNADYPALMKPYHGIYLFVNDGQNNFSQQAFYHLNGAYKAIPSDFDQDGDTDIAAISFFPDYVNQPEAGFVYLENTGQNQFARATFAEVTEGRWIVMEAGDVDEDGDTDLLLGSLAFETVPPTPYQQQWAASGLPFVLLENQLN